MKTIELYNDGYLIETYEHIKEVKGKGLNIGSAPIFVLESDDKTITIDQGLDFIIISEELDQDEIEKLIEDIPLKYLNMFYGNDTIFMQREIYKYSKSTHNDTISFIDYENNQLKKVVLVSKRAKESLHISLVSEK